MKVLTSGNSLTGPNADALAFPLPSGWGWYLYGITRQNGLGGAEAARESGLCGGPAHTLAVGELAAIVSLTPLAEFWADTVRARLQDSAWLEAMVRGHERVVDAFQRECGILPARFGCVFPSTEGVVAVLDRAHDALLTQLERVQGCDEWEVRFYMDRVAVQELAAAESPAMRQLLREISIAQPGRSYFLKRKLADVLDATTDQTLSDLAEAAYEHLAGYAVDSQVRPRTTGSRASHGEVEILVASFLVLRSQVGTFVGEIRRFVEGRKGLRSEYTGPWAPYSFTALKQEG